MISDTEAAYCAGLYDGEGSAMMLNFKNKKMIKLIISNTDKRPILWLKERFQKCCVSSYQPKGISKKGGAYKLIWYFQVSGKTATLFLNVVKPYIIIKKELSEKLLVETEY